MALKSRIELNNAVVLSVTIGMTSPMVARVTRKVLNRAEVRSPVRYGVLRGSHSMTMKVTRTTVAGRVYVSAKYAEAVHNGTRPHIIRPKGAKALAFEWGKMGGVQTFVPKKATKWGGLRKGKTGKVFLWIGKGYVRHPGTRARPWLYESLREVATLEGFIVRPTFGRGVGTASV